MAAWVLREEERRERWQAKCVSLCGGANSLFWSFNSLSHTPVLSLAPSSDSLRAIMQGKVPSCLRVVLMIVEVGGSLGQGGAVLPGCRHITTYSTMVKTITFLHVLSQQLSKHEDLKCVGLLNPFVSPSNERSPSLLLMMCQERMHMCECVTMLSPRKGLYKRTTNLFYWS